jgi:hypothetical protein
MSEVADVVLGFDNYPHPKGTVKSHEVLGALVYYAAEVEAKKEKRSEKASTVFLLDNRRLNAPQDTEKEFDNRYVAKVPSADKLQSLGIKSVMYLSPSESQTTELDDLNDDFATMKEKGIPVTMLAVTNFKPTVPLTQAITPDAKPEEIEQAKKSANDRNHAKWTSNKHLSLRRKSVFLPLVFLGVPDVYAVACLLSCV